MIIKRDFIYTPKGKNRPLHIWLPDDYYESDARYAVMYFFDGHNLFLNEDATYGKSWGLKEFLEGWNRDMIVVGIECGHEGQERLSEYLPYPADPGSHFASFAPMGDETIQWILSEVKPTIDLEYRTIPFREHTGIAGSSMGGLMALYAGVRYNRWFSKAGCISSAVGFCMGPVMADLEHSRLAPDSRFYLSWGTREAYGLADPTQEDWTSQTYHWNRQISDTLNAKGASAMICCQVGGGHCEADWEKLVPDFMDFLWMDWMQ